MFVTCFQEFRIYESTIFFTKCFLFSFKTRSNLCMEIKNVAKTIDFYKKRLFAVPLEENKTFFCEKKSWIRRLGIRENMPRASYKCGLPPTLNYDTPCIFLRLLREFLRIRF